MHYTLLILAMQTSSIRTSAIALCALAGLTACEQNNLISQPNSLPDLDSETSTSAKEEAARDGAASALAATQLATQGNRPETLKPESTRIKTSLGSVPTLNSRRYLPLPRTQAVLPRLNLAPAIVPQSTWKPPASLGMVTQMPTLPTASATRQPGLMAATPSQLGATNPALASLGNGASPAATASLASPQPVGSQPVVADIADVQDHWSQPIVAALLNANIVQGFADGTFRPDAPITQDQFVGMVQRAFPDEAISSDAVRLRPGMTRAEAAKVVYQALAEQGRVAPLATLVASQSQPLESGQVTAGQVTNGEQSAGQSNPSIATSTAQPDQTAVAAFPSPSPQPVGNVPMSDAPASDVPASDAPVAATNEGGTSLRSEIAQPMLQAAVLAAEAMQPNLADANASVSADSNRSSPGVSVAVMGEVSRPGGYSLVGTDNKPTLIQAIQMAGGVTATANIRQIQVRRAGAILTVDLWQVLQTGDLDQDLALQSGDTIAIPRAADLAVEGSALSSEALDRIQVSVVGEVNKPGVLELPPNALANQAIMASGGFNRQAQKADLIRLNANGTIVRRAIAIDVAQGANDVTNPRLQNNDVILVQRSSNIAIADQWTALNPLMKILPTSTAF
ncbi:MAG: SLBB domain-containing protein [Drouetiella hepatica Uher 2000/2452]|uniref:SLBB domain-containing protein n=1 Tax=Drouetiella hepatica Uher 2000/2452 TaxID=904376 RepID=A0A951QFX2_9CYAN|nr:SLBB domain-containing protein [Drouetiella hepatica Uher 2000/2452]